MVVERFGKLHAIHESGYFFAIPMVDSIAYVIDIRERALDIVPQSAITRDNVSVEVSGNLFVRVVDPERAAYGARNPLYSVMMVSGCVRFGCMLLVGGGSLLVADSGCSPRVVMYLNFTFREIEEELQHLEIGPCLLP